MTWHELLAGFTELPGKLLWRNDDDLYDRLSHRWTPALLTGFAIFITTTQYVGDAISCWVPKHFVGAWEDYTNNFCWIRNTYWLRWDQEIPREHDDRERYPIVYYQWTPFILMLQALCFYIPVIIWRGVNARSGIDVNDIVETAEKFQFADDMETKKKVLFFLTKQTHRYLGMARRPPSKGILRRYSPAMQNCLEKVFTPCCGKRFGNYMSVVYLITKFIMLANVFAQFFLLDGFLGFDYHNYGVFAINGLMNGSDWTDTYRFPRVTLCDLDVRRLGNVNRYTVQCVLSINLFNQMVFLLLWFWYIFVAVLTVVGIVLLMARMLYTPDRFSYIEKHLVVDDCYDPKDEKDRKLVKSFVENYLRQDGVLMLRLVGHNTNKVVVNDFISNLYKYFKSQGGEASLPHFTDSDDEDEEGANFIQ